jgi:hypothetical protein
MVQYKIIAASPLKFPLSGTCVHAGFELASACQALVYMTAICW